MPSSIPSASSSMMMSSTTASKRFSPSGQAVPILSSPFPMKCPLVHSTIPLPESGKLGVRFRWNGRSCDRVVITAIDDDSPLRQTQDNNTLMIQPHDTVVAVNHVAARKSSQVGQLIRLSHATVTLTTLPAQISAQLPPFTRISVAPCDDEPPFAVDSTRGRCLVRVSRVWGLSTTVHEGDVVLSLQGVPVTTPAVVDRLLLYGTEEDTESFNSTKERRQPVFPPSYVWMYTVDIQSYRTSVAWELQSAFPGVVWKEENDKQQQHRSSVVASISIGHDTKHSIPLEVDRETLHVHVAASHTTTKKLRHAKLVCRYLQALNQGMEDRMRLLETLVCGETYAYNKRRAYEQRRQHEQQMIQLRQHDELPPSVASTGSSRSRSKSTADTSLSSSSSSSTYGDDVCDAHHPDQYDSAIVSVPAALVLPIAALQTCEERDSTAETMAGY